MATMRRIHINSDDLPPCDHSERFFIPESAAHYIRDVLRLSLGEKISIFDGHGRLIVAEIVVNSGQGVALRALSDTISDRGESPLFITLCQAIPKGDRWEWLLEKSTELGVHQIVPLQTTRTVVKVAPMKVSAKLARWQKVVASAARQSGRIKVPKILPPHSIQEAIERTKNSPGFVLHTAPNTAGFAQSLSHLNATQLSIWIGPEGGFSDDEITRLIADNIQTYTLGSRVLRSETAGITAIAIAQSILGDLG